MFVRCSPEFCLNFCSRTNRTGFSFSWTTSRAGSISRDMILWLVDSSQSSAGLYQQSNTMSHWFSHIWNPSRFVLMPGCDSDRWLVGVPVGRCLASSLSVCNVNTWCILPPACDRKSWDKGEPGGIILLLITKYFPVCYCNLQLSGSFLLILPTDPNLLFCTSLFVPSLLLWVISTSDAISRTPSSPTHSEQITPFYTRHIA